MLMNYGSPFYLCYVLISVLLILAVGAFFRDRSDKTKYTVLYVIALLNLFQHLFKSLIWPHLFGNGINMENTAYNVCAALILLTPFLARSRSGIWREFVSFVGSIGPAMAILIPYWFIGKDPLGPDVVWEFLRFWTCHLFLVMTSVLPLLWRMIRFRFENWRFFGLCFFALLSAILLNDCFCFAVGLADGKGMSVYRNLYELNPLWTMHPPESFAWLTKTLVFLPPLKGGVYIPILWYGLPGYVGVTLIALVLELLMKKIDRPQRGRLLRSLSE